MIPLPLIKGKGIKGVGFEEESKRDERVKLSDFSLTETNKNKGDGNYGSNILR
jgi:hypothetical protein